MTYTVHGIAQLDYDSLFKTLETIKPLSRSEWGVDYWHTNRDEAEIKIKSQYSEQSVSYYQYADDMLVNFIPQHIIKDFDIDTNNAEVKVIKYPPGSFTPPHVDRFNSLKKKHSLDSTENIIRLWIALQKPTFGHALFFENDVVHDVPQGTMITWDHEARHSACNAGVDDRYIMTITALVDKKVKV